MIDMQSLFTRTIELYTQLYKKFNYYNKCFRIVIFLLLHENIIVKRQFLYILLTFKTFIQSIVYILAIQVVKQK